MGALLVFNYHHYRYSLSPQPDSPLGRKDTTQELQPESTLLRLPDSFYYSVVITGQEE